MHTYARTRHLDNELTCSDLVYRSRACPCMHALMHTCALTRTRTWQVRIMVVPFQLDPLDQHDLPRGAQVVHTLTHTLAHTHTRTHARAHTCAKIEACVRAHNRSIHTHTPSYPCCSKPPGTRSRTHAHTHTCARTRMHAHARARTHAYTLPHRNGSTAWTSSGVMASWGWTSNGPWRPWSRPRCTRSRTRPPSRTSLRKAPPRSVRNA